MYSDFILVRNQKAARSLFLVSSPISATQFYDNHIKDWPELALVAEYVERQNVSDLSCLGIDRPACECARRLALSRWPWILS